MSERPLTMTAGQPCYCGPGDRCLGPAKLLHGIGCKLVLYDAERAAHDSTEHEIRKALWLGHRHEGLYGDDGEMQCNIGGCMLEFKRDPLDKIIAKLFQIQLDSSEQTIRELEGELARAREALFSDEQIKHMRDRFLNWTIPKDFNPDGGISFKRSESAVKYNHPYPVGTNLLDATQAEEMVRYMVVGIPPWSAPETGEAASHETPLDSQDIGAQGGRE